MRAALEHHPTGQDAGILERTINPELAAVYAPEVLAAAPFLLGQVDREADSVSFGVVDREHWAWKFRDHPIGTLQLASYPLAVLWRYALPDNPYHGNARVLQWILAVFENTLSRQHRNGAFSAFVPNEQDPMGTLQLMYGLARTREALGDQLPSALEERYRAAFGRAARFARAGDEKHAFVSNHSALMAVAFHDAYEAVEVDSCRERAAAIIDRIIERQSPDGWYDEYGGPDPGYETLGIFYLAQYWQRTADPRVLESLRRSMEFAAYGVHPDGSIGGVYGSRHTSLYVPGGFEILAPEIPLAASIARFMRARLERGNVVTPSAADAENVVPLSYGYVEACLAGPDASVPGEGTLPASGGKSPPPLPCELDDVDRHFEDSGWSAVATPSYYAVLNARKGGVCRIFDRVRERLAFEEAGYVVRSGTRVWSSQILGLGEGAAASGELECTARLGHVRQQLPSPLRLIVLRLLNLTLFRHAGLGNWLRKQIAVRLILPREPGPLTLHRRVVFAPSRIDFTDRLELAGRARVGSVSLPRSYTAIHMGSAKYYHPSELEPVPEVRVGGMRDALSEEGVAEIEFALVFGDGGGMELVTRGPGRGSPATATG